jgi:TonB-linked SusC/RagA family outer membrane protein
MRKFTLFFVFLLFVGMQAALAQMEVKGTITDTKDGTPLPGVSVVVKGTLTGTVTDINGKYILTVPSGYNELIFSFVGMLTKETKIDGRAVIDVGMEDDVVGLNEVVVTALGISREKKSLGYSVQDMKGEELAKAKETNIVNSLSGKISGVQVTNSSGAVGSSSRIVIRGVNVLNGNNQPLFVVDGVPISNNDFAAGDGLGGAGRAASKNNGTNRGNGAADINPDDVESISVLKGSNAAALYGSRAANGVILITTKSGKTGASTRKGLNVELSNSTTFEKPLRMPNWQNEYGQGAEGVFSFVDGAGGGTKDGVDESWGPKLDAGLMIPQYNSPVVDGVRQPTPWVSHPDNINDFLETGVTTTTNLAIVGGYTDANFRLSYTNMNQKGMLPNTDFIKNTISMGASANATEKLNISGTVNYVSAKSNNLPGYGYDAQNVFQQFLWAARQVNYPDLKNYTNPDGSKYNWNYNYHNNPYFTLNENLNTLDRDRVYGNAKILYKFTSYLSAFVRTGVDYYSNLSTERAAWGDIDNAYGFYDENQSNFRELNSDFLLMFDKYVSTDFNLNVNLGGNYMGQNYHSTFGAADELAVEGVYTLANAKVPLRATSTQRDKVIQSLYGSAQLGWKSALFLDVTARNDWSSTLPKTNWSYFYPSFTLSCILTDLLKLKDSKTWSYGKIRAGYAIVGSDTDPYNLLPVLSFGDGWNSSTKYLNQYVPNTLPDPNLKSQKQYGLEIGGEFKFFMNRISLDITYYNQQTKDQIITVPVSGATGYTAMVTNAGQIDNTGIEITFGAIPIKGDGDKFNWDIFLNFAKNKNEVVALKEGIEQYELGTYWDLKVMAIPGQPYGSLYGADFLRDPDGNIINRNGVPVKGDLKILGNFQPDWVGGITNDFSLKGFDLSFLIDIHKGGDIYSMTNAWGRYAGALDETLIGREGGIVGVGVKEVLDADGNVTGYAPNDVVVTAEEYNHAAFTNSIPAGSIFDATYVKLREVRFGYTFKNLGDFPIKGITISLVGRNLAILYSTIPHVDPETSFTNGNVQGLEFGQLPSARSLGFNINLKF